MVAGGRNSRRLNMNEFKYKKGATVWALGEHRKPKRFEIMAQFMFSKEFGAAYEIKPRHSRLKRIEVECRLFETLKEVRHYKELIG
jgi:hypothetical protein